MLRIHLDTTKPLRGLVAEVDAEREAPIFLIRERVDGRRLPVPSFVASPGPHGVRMSSGEIASEYATAMRVAIGSDADEPLTVHGATVTELPAVPPHPVASIIALEHHNDLDIAPGKVAAALWLPLPAVIGGQVPLDVRAWLEPADAGELEIVRDGPVNVGLVVHFPPRATAVRVSVSWTGVVLVRDVLPEERATFPELSALSENWLAATALADANAPEAQRIAMPIVAAHADDEARALALHEWLDGLELVPPGAASNSATDVLASGSRAKCTGSANMAVALGRAIGVPTRHLAGVVTDDRLQTHSIVEMRLGTPPSWRRFEPQNGTVVADDYMVVMRVVPPRDEVAAAMDPRRIGAPGVPLRILIEGLEGTERLGYRDDTEWFPGCPRCDNAATRQATLQDVSLEEVRRLHDRARRTWDCRLDAAIREGSVTRLHREGDQDIATLDDLARYVAAAPECLPPKREANDR